MVMFFDKQYNTEIIDNTKTYEGELPEQWAELAYKKGIEEDLSEMYSINFGSIISLFLTGRGVDAGTDVYFRLEVDDAIFDLYEDCKNNYADDEECVKQFFYKVLSFYKDKEGVCLYEKAVFHHNIRINCELKRWFESQGQSSRKTIMNLMQNKVEKPSLAEGKECNLTFKLTYSEEEQWMIIPGDDDPSKLREIVSGS